MTNPWNQFRSRRVQHKACRPFNTVSFSTNSFCRPRARASSQAPQASSAVSSAASFSRPSPFAVVLSFTWCLTGLNLACMVQLACFCIRLRAERPHLAVWLCRVVRGYTCRQFSYASSWSFGPSFFTRNCDQVVHLDSPNERQMLGSIG